MRDQAALAAELETRLARFVEQNRLPGGAAGVVCGGELTWSGSTGFADGRVASVLLMDSTWVRLDRATA